MDFRLIAHSHKDLSRWTQSLLGLGISLWEIIPAFQEHLNYVIIFAFKEVIPAFREHLTNLIIFGHLE